MEWIKIEEKLPEFDEKVLTWNANEEDEPPRTDTLKSIEENSKGRILKWWENGYPTHWTPLPEPPKNKN